MRKIYNIADKKIKITSPFESYDEDNIKMFLSNNSDEEADICYDIVKGNDLKVNEENLIYEEYKIKVYKNEDEIVWKFGDCKSKIGYSSLVENKDKVRKLYAYGDIEKLFPHTSAIFTKLNIQGSLLRNDVLILHSSFIIHNNKSILFTAPSGTGKSTQAGLWEKYKDAEIINGDRSAIGVRNNEYFAYGIPFSGSSKICKNKEAKINVIVALEQSKENSVRKLSKIEAVKILLSQVAINRWNKEEMKIVMSLIEQLIEKVPVLLLSCRPDKEATDVLSEYLNNELELK